MKWLLAGAISAVLMLVGCGDLSLRSILANLVYEAKTVHVTGISVTKQSTSLLVGGTEQLYVEITPTNATNTNIRWATSALSVVAVSDTGLITGLAVGSATITVATDDGGKTAVCNVTVVAAPISVTGVLLNKSTDAISVGGTDQLIATIVPANATNQNITWSSDTPTVATVSQGGLVAGISTGTATITVTTVDQGKQATCFVTVNDPVVAYFANGATSGSPPVDNTPYQNGDTVTVLGAGTLVKAGATLAGWNTTAAGTGTSYSVGATFVKGAGNLQLYAVWIPNTLTFTGSGTTITLTGYTVAPSGALAVPGGVTALGSYCLMNCSALTSVAIPSSVTTIGWRALMNASALASITISPNVTSIGSEAFANCTSLSSVTLPASLSTIGSFAFQNTGLTSVTIPASVTTMDQAFVGCGSLTAINVDSSNVTFKSVGGVVFNSTGTSVLSVPGGLTSYTIPSTATSIGARAFQSCTKLASVSIPTTVTSIGDYAFGGCPVLSGVTIPASVSSIGQRVFNSCVALTNIDVDAANLNYKSANSALLNKAGTLLIAVPGALSSFTIPSSVTTLGDFSFYGCVNLTSITVPPTVTNLGNYTFDGCSSLTSVTLPTSVSVIGYGEFSFCTSLAGITLPSTITTIRDEAFYYCPYLSSISIPYNVSTIGNRAFYTCASLVTVTMAPTVPPALPVDSQAFSDGNAGIRIHVPVGTLTSYQAAQGWSDYASIMMSP